jgi:nifR3 family TIM-barrel protein
MGADLTYTEMISAKGLEYKSSRTEQLLFATEEEKPVAVQLFGKDPEAMAQQARYLEEHQSTDIVLLDINMGCPARKIAGKGEGAALMKEPELAESILKAVVAAVELPVTVKFRKGYERGSDTAVEFAKMAEGCGVAAMTVHGRTAQQLYTGKSDRDVIARVKQAVSVPVIASGDVYGSEDIRAYREDFGADGVMAARGAQGNPWIFSGVTPTLEERVRIAREHTTGLAQLQPQRLPSMRKHISWYFKGTERAVAIRRAVHACATLEDYETLFEQILVWR